jgi:type 1 glutamine amidotransferase
VPASFTVRDELYRFEADAGAENEVLAVGRALSGPDPRNDGETLEFPVVWTRTQDGGRIVVLTLGHDGGAHEHATYRVLLQNAVRWVGWR